MKNSHLPKPTEAELQILQVLWQKGEASVKEVHECLCDKEVAYTTILKTLQIMTEKGLVSRNKHGKMHLYEAVAQEQETQKRLLDKLMDSAFGGSAMKLVMQALGNRKASKSELDEIKALIKDIEQEGGKQ